MSDSERLHIVNHSVRPDYPDLDFQYATERSRPYRPELPEIDISCHGAQTNYHERPAIKTRPRGVSNPHEYQFRHAIPVDATNLKSAPVRDRLEVPVGSQNPFAPRRSHSNRVRERPMRPSVQQAYERPVRPGYSGIPDYNELRPKSARDLGAERFGSFKFESPSHPESEGVPPSSPRTEYSYHSSHASTQALSTASLQYDDLFEDGIRLLQIHPRRMAAIKCTMLHTYLRNPEEYMALSYAWGDSDRSEDKDIEITYKNGSQICMTQVRVNINLYQALKALRDESKTVLLWVDALCINQQNKKEQSQQVQLMTQIYSRAQGVVIWLGTESPRSEMGIILLRRLAEAGKRRSRGEIRGLIRSKEWFYHFFGLVSLFDRPYWKRLWVVQEVLIGLEKGVTVYCGNSKLDWSVFEDASQTLGANIPELRDAFPRGSYTTPGQHSFTTVLTAHGPSSLRLQAYTRDLHRMLRICRSKLATEPRDKVLGIMGVMPEDIRKYFADYNAPLRKIYIDVADFLLHNTSCPEPRVDIICDAIHFPLHNSTLSLPTWVPDWSHIPDVQPLSRAYAFRAATGKKCIFKLEDPRTELDLATVTIGKVQGVGVAVGTFCKIDDYLMAFVNWRNKFLESTTRREGDAAFCRTIRLDQPTRWLEKDDVKTCFHVFASLIRERLPYIRVDSELDRYADLGEEVTGVRVRPNDDGRTKILQENSTRVQGRRFFITDRGHMGLGTGFLEVDDIVCVPWGGSTPIILRPDGPQVTGRECRFVGDAYVDGYMYGKAVDQVKEGVKTHKWWLIH